MKAWTDWSRKGRGVGKRLVRWTEIETSDRSSILRGVLQELSYKSDTTLILYQLPTKLQTIVAATRILKITILMP